VTGFPNNPLAGRTLANSRHSDQSSAIVHLTVTSPPRHRGDGSHPKQYLVGVTLQLDDKFGFALHASPVFAEFPEMDADACVFGPAIPCRHQRTRSNIRGRQIPTAHGRKESHTRFRSLVRNHSWLVAEYQQHQIPQSADVWSVPLLTI